jgi:hypothetical protein
MLANRPCFVKFPVRYCANSTPVVSVIATAHLHDNWQLVQLALRALRDRYSDWMRRASELANQSRSRVVNAPGYGTLFVAFCTPYSALGICSLFRRRAASSPQNQFR